MMERRSDGVRTSTRYFMVLFTSSIFYPLIDPLTSITQIKSTFVLEPPSVLREIIAGKVWASLSLTIDLWALIEISILTSLIGFLTSSVSFGTTNFLRIVFFKFFEGIYFCYLINARLTVDLNTDNFWSFCGDTIV
jgi:hypothetical protein